MSAILNPVPTPPTPQPASVPAATSEPKGPRRFVWLIGVALLAVAGILAWQWNARQEAARQATAISPVRTATVTKGALISAIRVSGQTASREFINITAPRLMGPEGNRPLVIQKLSPSGTMVKKGDIVVQIDGQTLQDHVDDVHSTVIQSEADIKKRKAEQAVEWENLEQSVRVSKAQLDKLRVDARATEVRTAIDQELIKLSVEEADASYQELLTELTLKKISQQSELKILDFTRERHTRHRDRHKGDVLKYTVRAPIDGMAVVQSVFRGGEFVAIGDGDQVFPGQLLVKIVNPRKMQVEGTINQTASSHLRLGQKANVSLDAFPGLKFQGTVYSIGAIAVSGFRQQAYVRNIPVRVAIEGFEQRLIPDLSAAADVKIAQQDNATLVPLSAIRYDGDKALAYVKDDGKFIPREVKLGEQNGLQAAVVSGLQAGDEVALNYEVAAK